MGSPPELPVARVQLLEVVDMLQDINRLRASAPFNATNPQSDDFAIADTHLVTALALVYLQQRDAALDQLDAAAAKYEADDDEAQKLLDLARGRANLIAPPSVRSLY
jgi:type II secretory pathway component PulM